EPVGPAADTYSVGAVLYELLTGRPPYQFDSLAELGELQSAGFITPPRDLERSVPARIEAAVMRALAREPRFRPPSVADFAQQLAGATEEEPTEPLRATTLAEGPRTRGYRSAFPKSRWALRSAAVTAALALVAVVIAITETGDS